MSGLRENSDQICSVIQVSVKGTPEDFKNWVKNRSSKYVLEFEMIRSQEGNVLNFRTSVVGGLIVIKNLIYWSINFGLIIISRNIIFKHLIRI